ncbi:MAG: paraquat-inducible protein A [Maricaulis sp.]|uniref:paraquat-inducible protein A n=1 Tax=Maricaulis sp. TaxID=1486257 RepID=UPI001B0E1EFC|nr:paraquat-inducible protein A [Maricaulis sp.]MBO6847155.1 paraquat-inducible protein A [Maricaulis sp.]MBO6876813.1 paraquat-inducible protein A [Maricaulis sp.]MDM7983911.1 paraquat-inducible protein A [Maricaulis sp.]
MSEAVHTHQNGLTTALLVLSTALLPLGLFLPALVTTQFAFWQGEHSIIGVGFSLLEGEEYLLAGVVWLFSVVFPASKLIWMWRLNAHPAPLPHKAVRRLEWFGKWSMGDVFIIALIVFSARSNSILDVSIAPGLVAFAASVVLAMFASGRLARRVAQPSD